MRAESTDSFNSLSLSLSLHIHPNQPLQFVSKKDWIHFSNSTNYLAVRSAGQIMLFVSPAEG